MPIASVVRIISPTHPAISFVPLTWRTPSGVTSSQSRSPPSLWNRFSARAASWYHSREYFQVLQEVCRKHGILVIADEVQTGIGRTGRFFASEHFGLRPDLLVSSKSLAGGLPLAAVIGKADIMDAPDVGALGSTFGGNPLSCAAALAVLDIMEKGNLLQRSNEIGERVWSRANKWKERFSLVGDVRALGAMAGIELVTDRESKSPAKEATQRVAQLALERGLLTITAGTYGNVIRTLMPLVIRDEELEEGLDVLEAALEQVNAEL